MSPARSANRGPPGRRSIRGIRKGIYTQGVVVLFEAAPKTQALSRALDQFAVLGERPGSADPDAWAFGGPSVLLDYRPKVNGRVQVDVVDRVWPDHMGDPKSEVTLFGAWTMGHFGPCTYPGALTRAVQHAWNWPDGRALAGGHKAFVRIRSSYVLGLSEDAILQPDDYDPLDELRFVTRVQRALGSMQGALAAFNPNGELLVSGETLSSALTRDEAGGDLAMEAWTNVRMFRPHELKGQWLLFDTPGLGQLDVTDHEAAIPFEHPSTEHVPGLLLSMAAYDTSHRGVLGPGDTATDLGGVMWRASAAGDSLVAPPRPVLRWHPDGEAPPPALG